MEDGGYRCYFLDLATGEASLAKMQDQDVTSPYLFWGAWDPVEPAYMYAMIPDSLNDDDIMEFSLWRVHSETLVGTPILPSGNYGLSDITPDGRYLLVYRWDEDFHPSLYSLETHTWTPIPEEDILYNWPTYAPNRELLAGFTYDLIPDLNPTLAIRDVAISRVAQVFHANQALFSVPPGAHPDFSGGPTWLPDSAGLFVNMRSTGDDGTEIIWKVGIKGDANPIANGVSVRAHSQNGRHWLLQHEQQFYVMTVDDTAPEE